MRRGFIYTITAFAISIVLLTVLSFLYADRLKLYMNSRNQIDSSRSVLGHLYKLSYLVREAERGQRSFLLSADSAFHQQFISADAEIDSTKKKIHELVRNNTDLSLKYGRMNMELIDRLDKLENMLHRHDTVTLEAIISNHPPRTQLTDFIEVMERQETKALDALEERKQSYEKFTSVGFQVIFLFALIIFIVSFIALLRQISLRNMYHRRMEEKIKQINQANKELERITFIASHDLQEPLRKMRTFSNLLATRHANELTGEGLRIVERIDHSATVMQELIRDLGDYTNLVRHHGVLQKVDLNELLAVIEDQFAHALSAHNGSLRTERLPVLWGYPDQLKMLFCVLLDNSLKFARAGVPPRIIISYQKIKGDCLPPAEDGMESPDCHQITVSDNGTGFDAELAEKMFMMFQRLHNQETGFTGRGMGLAIAKRVMVNHSGNIIGKGRPGLGADFELYFPV